MHSRTTSRLTSDKVTRTVVVGRTAFRAEAMPPHTAAGRSTPPALPSQPQQKLERPHRSWGPTPSVRPTPHSFEPAVFSAALNRSQEKWNDILSSRGQPRVPLPDVNQAQLSLPPQHYSPPPSRRIVKIIRTKPFVPAPPRTRLQCVADQKYTNDVLEEHSIPAIQFYNDTTIETIKGSWCDSYYGSEQPKDTPLVPPSTAIGNTRFPRQAIGNSRFPTAPRSFDPPKVPSLQSIEEADKKARARGNTRFPRSQRSVDTSETPSWSSIDNRRPLHGPSSSSPPSIIPSPPSSLDSHSFAPDRCALTYRPSSRFSKPKPFTYRDDTPPFEPRHTGNLRSYHTPGDESSILFQAVGDDLKLRKRIAHSDALSKLNGLADSRHHATLPADIQAMPPRCSPDSSLDFDDISSFDSTGILCGTPEPSPELEPARTRDLYIAPTFDDTDDSDLMDDTPGPSLPTPRPARASSPSPSFSQASSTDYFTGASSSRPSADYSADDSTGKSTSIMARIRRILAPGPPPPPPPADDTLPGRDTMRERIRQTMAIPLRRPAPAAPSLPVPAPTGPTPKLYPNLDPHDLSISAMNESKEWPSDSTPNPDNSSFVSYCSHSLLNLVRWYDNGIQAMRKVYRKAIGRPWPPEGGVGSWY